jgi:L-amino acid N-acyltransferase YncA
MVIDSQPATTAFAAFVHGKQLEMGIETAPPHRGKGYAVYICQALIGHCLKEGFEPIWACRLENAGSFRLAKKLGFEPTLYLPYYQLVSHP